MRLRNRGSLPGRRRLVLPSGRAVAWAEFGDPTGLPCLYLPGTPNSAASGQTYDAAGRDLGVRVLALDKPGYGASDPVRRRRLADIAHDVDALARHLSIDRLLVVGESGGAPHALALAAALPARVVAVAIVAGIGPTTPADLAAFTPSTRRLMKLARRSPLLVQAAYASTRRRLLDPDKAQTHARSLIAAAPPADRAVLAAHPQAVDIALRSTVEALGRGTRAVAQELAMFARPWEFDLSAVAVPVDVWHGSDDANVPLVIAKRVAAALPDGQFRVLAGCGHSLGLGHASAVLGSLVERATRQPDVAGNSVGPGP